MSSFSSSRMSQKRERFSEGSRGQLPTVKITKGAVHPAHSNLKCLDDGTVNNCCFVDGTVDM